MRNGDTLKKEPSRIKKLGSKLNYLVRYPILFMVYPWRATEDTVRERVFLSFFVCVYPRRTMADLVRVRFFK